MSFTNVGLLTLFASGFLRDKDGKGNLSIFSALTLKEIVLGHPLGLLVSVNGLQVLGLSILIMGFVTFAPK